MATTQELAARFSRLFAGLDRAYGTYRVSTTKENGKRVGDKPGDILTKQGQVTEALWAGHLDGKQGIGIVPIRDDATCVFGAIDVDDYTLGKVGRAKVVERVAEAGLPLVPCSTKSGGVHLYMFACEPVDAKLMRARLSEMAAALGFSGSEIFPKQERITSERDCGSWINMPYMNLEEGGRHGLRIDGEAMPAEEFLDFVDGMARPASFFEEQVAVAGAAFADGPPCLQRIAERGGFSSGNRNNLLFDAAVYARKSAGDDWRNKLHQINESVCSPPLDRAEVDGVCGSVARKKTYKYRCRTEPLKDYCDSKVCRLRAFGVGRDGDGDGGGQGDGGAAGVENESFPRLGQLRKLLVDPPLWFWDTHAGRTIELTTDELQSPRLFQKRCIETLNMMPTMPNQQAWQTFLNEALSKCVDIAAPEDSSDEGQVWELLEKFCTGKVQAQTRKEILLGKPWTSEGTTWFRLSDFRRYMDQQRFHSELTKTNKLSALFHKRGLEKEYFMLDKQKGSKAKGANVWGVASFAGQPEMDVPESVTKDEAPF